MQQVMDPRPLPFLAFILHARWIRGLLPHAVRTWTLHARGVRGWLGGIGHIISRAFLSGELPGLHERLFPSQVEVSVPQVFAQRGMRAPGLVRHKRREGIFLSSQRHNAEPGMQLRVSTVRPATSAHFSSATVHLDPRTVRAHPGHLVEVGVGDALSVIDHDQSRIHNLQDPKFGHHASHSVVAITHFR